MGTQTTGEVARELGTIEPRLTKLLRHAKIPKPTKGPDGKYAWSKKDKENARAALARNRAATVV